MSSGLRTLLTTGSRAQRARWALRLVTPWGIEWLLFLRRNRAALRQSEADRVQEDPALRQIEADRALEVPPAGTRVEEAIRFLVGRGLDELQVREGSMPEDSLNYIAELVCDSLPSDRPVRALHVGNFVGASLCCFSWLVGERHPGSVVVSVDPNATHRGIEDPQGHVVALLHHFGLLANNVIVPGYTLEQTPGERAAENPAGDHLEGLACENVLASLERLRGEGFDLVLLDGNHERSYLARELAALRGLLADGSLVVFDDITQWEGVVEVFGQALQDDSFAELGQDGRVGVLRCIRTPASCVGTVGDAGVAPRGNAKSAALD